MMGMLYDLLSRVQISADVGKSNDGFATLR